VFDVRRICWLFKFTQPAKMWEDASMSPELGNQFPPLSPCTAKMHGGNPPTNGDRGRSEETTGCTGKKQK